MASSVARSLRKLPGKVGLGDIRLTPEMGNVASLESSLTDLLSKGGVSVVDTSGVYDHGQTEEAVGKVLETVTSSGGLSKDDFFVISKFGYRSNEKKEISHSFDVEKMNESLETSLRRLDTPSLDSFLLHDPERQLINAYPFPPPNDDGVIADIELDPRERDEFLQEAMFECIKGLEEQVKAGRISSYGLSSNNIVLPSNHPHHVNLDLVAKMATEAAQEIGHEQHSLSVLQLPFNVIESNGLQTAKKAKDTYGMHVMALRPLTVVDPPVLWKLEGLPDPAHKDSWSGIDQVQKLDAVFQETADYFVPPEPVSSENPTKDELELIEACGYMKTLLTDLKSEFPKFVSEDHYEMNLTADLIPLIHKTFDGMDETSIEVLQNFFKAYGDAVRAVAPYHAKKYIESVLDPFPPDGGDGIQRVHQVPDDVKLEQYSLKWLMRKQSPIDTILLDVTSMGTLG